MRKFYLFLLSFLFLIQIGNAQTITDLVNRSNSFINSLSDSQKGVIKYSFEDKLRTNWTNLPIGLKPREGIKYGELSAESKVAFHRVLTTLFSSQGYLKINSIMSLDDILNIIYKERFDSGQINEKQYQRMLDLDWERDNFFISIWGKPDLNEPWTIKLGGHHIGIHATAVGGEISLSPIFLGTDPSEVLTTEFAGIRVLSKEEDYGFLFINALTDAQKKVAIINTETPRDIITTPGRPQMIYEYTGIKASELKVNQKEILKHIIKEYLNNMEFGEANKAFQKIEKAGFDNIYFAWIGSEVPRVNHYYVINGPTFLIEYDNAGFENDGNHIHSIYREKGNDFGEDILKTHYLEHKH